MDHLTSNDVRVLVGAAAALAIIVLAYAIHLSASWLEGRLLRYMEADIAERTTATTKATTANTGVTAAEIAYEDAVDDALALVAVEPQGGAA